MEEKNKNNYLSERLDRLTRYIESYSSDLLGNTVGITKKLAHYLSQSGLVPPALESIERGYMAPNYYISNKDLDDIDRECTENIILNNDSNNLTFRRYVILGWFFSRDKLPLVETDKDVEENYKKVVNYINSVRVLGYAAPHIFQFYKLNFGSIIAVMNEEEKAAIDDVANKWLILKYNHFKHIADQISQPGMDLKSIVQKLVTYNSDYPMYVKMTDSGRTNAEEKMQAILGGTINPLYHNMYPRIIYFCYEFAKLEQLVKDLNPDTKKMV